MADGESAARTRDIFVVKNTVKCTLIIIEYNLYMDKQHPVCYLNNKEPKTSCLHEIEIQIFQNKLTNVIREQVYDKCNQFVLCFSIFADNTIMC